MVQTAHSATAPDQPPRGPETETESCPWCGQSITHEEFRRIEARIKAEERRGRAKFEEELKQQFQRQEALRVAKAEDEMRRLREEAASAVDGANRQIVEREAAARADAKKAAEAEMEEKLVAAQRAKLAAEEAKAAAEREKLEALNQERENSSQKLKQLEDQVGLLRKEKETAAAAIEEEKRQAAEREATIRAEAKKAAEDEMKEKLLAAQQEKLTAEQAKAAAEREKLEALDQEREKSSQKLKQLDEQVGLLKKQNETAVAAIEDERTKAQQREEAIREETKAAAEGHARTEQEETRRHYVEEMQKQREALEKDKEASLNQAKAKAFTDSQKLESKIEDLKRQVQGQTAAELGEGAEVDLYDVLQEEFKDDRLQRIGKGEPGADVLHDVIYQGECCGRIVYDSKNRKAWRNEYIEKLRKDQLAAEADHALLSTSVFPAGERQVCIRDGVIIANPARSVVLVQILREHIILAYRLRLSGQDRESKTGQLYEFINSDRCQQLLQRGEEMATQLLELDVSEQQAHSRVWQKRGALIRTAEKANRDLRSELDRIVGSYEG